MGVPFPSTETTVVPRPSGATSPRGLARMPPRSPEHGDDFPAEYVDRAKHVAAGGMSDCMTMSTLVCGAVLPAQIMLSLPCFIYIMKVSGRLEAGWGFPLQCTLSCTERPNERREPRSA